MSASTSSGSWQDVVDDLKGMALEMMRTALPRSERYLLLAPPAHGNVGDSAIWLGQASILRTLGRSFGYEGEVGGYRRDTIERWGPRTLLLNGGGDLGDLWPAPQAYREHVIQDFRSNRVIQLPQSVYFKEEAALQRAAQIFSNHPSLGIFARDPQSQSILQERMGMRSDLCPDLAFALGRIPRFGRPRVEVVWLARQDAESGHGWSDPLPPGVHRLDWTASSALDRRRYPRLSAARRWSRFAWRRTRGTGPWTQRHLMWATDALARARLRRGCQLLSAGRVVITDRLHGHILSLLMGIPHVVLDNSYGKVRAFVETWTAGSALVRLADSPQAALDAARSLAKRDPVSSR